jgi:hypothetical protein
MNRPVAPPTSDHRWWSPAELASTTETVWPERLADLLRAVERR